MTTLSRAIKNWLFDRNSLIFIADAILFVVMLNTLPFEANVVVGLSLLTFIAILWLTEAIHVSITAILVPFLAVGLGVFKTPEALGNFANPIIFLFLGGFSLASAMHRQDLDKAIADKVLLIAKGHMAITPMSLYCLE